MKGKIKVNLIIPSFYPAVVYGGPIFSTLYACEELSKLDDIDIFVSTTNTNMTSKLDVEINKFVKVKNFYVKYYDETIIDKFSWSLYKNIYKDIKNSNIVHIQAIFDTPIPLSILLAVLYKKPILISARGSLDSWSLIKKRKFKLLWLKIFFKPFSKYIYWHATAQEEKEEILKIFPNANVTIIPNGVSLEEYKNINYLSKIDYIKKYINKKVDKVDKIIVSMGRLQKKKGFDILIKSFQKVLNKFQNSYLLIAGSDEGEQENLINLIKSLKLENNVFLIGLVNGQDKIDFLANADVFVLPSHTENFGNVYVESLAAGTPIVASINTPWSEVEKYNCGRWVDNNVSDTTDAIFDVLKKDRDILRQNSINFSKNYEWKNIAIAFKKLYEKMKKENIYEV